MVFSVAFQMDHIGSVDIDADSTFVLALEAQNRGHALYHYLPDALTLNGEQVIAAAQRLKLRREAG
ncbi:MAG: glutathione synthase, partial [Pseudomonadota bacterium]|nr:glutathione synthase [Pseudomonadota bacterium]